MEEIQQLMTSSEVGKTKGEVMHHHRFKDDLEEVVVEALLKRRSNTTTTTTRASSSSDNSRIDEPITEEAENDDNEENDVYLDKNEAEWPQFIVKVDDLAATFNENGGIQRVQSAVMSVISGKPVENTAGPSKKEPETAATYEQEETDDEEVVELEIGTAVDKMRTHKDYHMYRPHCSSQITVVIRTKKSHGPVSGSSRFLEIVKRIVYGVLKLIASVVSPPAASGRFLEIVKSIVYGGLLESIASLSVVSSAAASGATTLNIVVLGLANLVGGLVVLVHNLRDLRYGESNQTNEERYKEELGKKDQHFLVHATVAVLSYIIFGLIPPVIYGFTFRETNDRDFKFKMLAVAAASFLCIFILAIAKVYGRGEHQFKTYLKTVLYYLTSAIIASGVAFAVGDLAKKLIEKVGWLDPATVEPRSFQSTWASY